MNMTGDPNQQNRPSVFGVDCNYPSSSQVDWNKFMPPPGIFPSQSPNGFVPTPPGFMPQMSTSFSFSNTARTAPVQFPFNTNVPSNTLHPIGEFGNRPLYGRVPHRCKRKTDSPPPIPPKQLITDEKMAEHMSHLHINSESESSSESQPVREQRLYLCEEMRRLQQESILPQSLLNRIHRPCTALMLWTPPNRIHPLNDEDTVENNNDEDALDNNVMELDPMN